MSPPKAFVTHEDDCELEGWADPARGPVRWRTLLSGDRTPTEQLTLGIAELPPGEPARPRTHRHAQPEAYYVLSGEGCVSIDGAQHLLRAGSAVFLPGNAAHALRNTGAEPLRILYVFPASSFAEVEYEFES